MWRMSGRSISYVEWTVSSQDITQVRQRMMTRVTAQLVPVNCCRYSAGTSVLMSLLSWYQSAGVSHLLCGHYALVQLQYIKGVCLSGWLAVCLSGCLSCLCVSYTYLQKLCHELVCTPSRWCLCPSLSVSLYVCLSVCLSVCVCVSATHTYRNSVMSWFVHLHADVSVLLCLTVSLYVCLSVCLSVVIDWSWSM